MNIGLLVHHYFSSYTKVLTEKIQSECERKGHRLFVFEGRALGSNEDLFKYYNSVYSLVGHEGLDGLIIASSIVVASDNMLAAERYVSQLGIPVVCIGRKVGRCPVIQTDNRTGIIDMFDHLYQHGKRKIALVTGKLYQVDGVERKEQYIRSLKSHHMPYDDSLVIEGDFSSQSGHQAAIAMESRIREGAIDGILFSNDDMAFAALARFREIGLRCPEDIPVTGYDNTSWSNLTDPPLTTVSQNHTQLVEATLGILFRMILGKKVPQDTLVPVTPVIRTSCGCSDYSMSIHKQGLAEIPQENFMLTEFLQNYNMELLQDMLERNLSTQGILDFAVVRYPHVLPFRDFHRFELPETARVDFCTVNGMRIHHEAVFPPRSLLPEEVLDRMHSRSLIIKPLFFSNEVFGYLVVGCSTNTDHLVDEVRLHLSNLIKGSLLLDERIVMEHRLKEALGELRMVNRRLNDLSVRDELTGLFNRRGFIQESSAYLAESPNENYLIAYVDMDNLKRINDIHGHDEGDAAIRIVAQILTSSVRDRDIVCRQGGDEFILLVKGASDTLMPVMEHRFSENLRLAVETHGKPYEIGFSWGLLLAGQNDRLEETIRLADERMMTRKRLKKARVSAV